MPVLLENSYEKESLPPKLDELAGTIQPKISANNTKQSGANGAKPLWFKQRVSPTRREQDMNALDGYLPP